MTVSLPDPTPLDMPPGDPQAVEALAGDVAQAVYRLAGLGEVLSGPAATAPGWRGDDAAAAVGQVARVAALARESSAAVLTASGRLYDHGRLLRETRRAIERLRQEQAEDARAAQLRLGQMENPHLAVMTGDGGWAGVVADVEAAEDHRRRQHAVLLEELAADAIATARVLADASRPLGGTGRAGDGLRVLAHLALELPGWAAPELTRRGRALAAELLRSPLSPEERAELSAASMELAADPAFANALLRELGQVGVGRLLGVLGYEPDAPDRPLAAVLAAALGAAVASGRPHDEIAEVLAATYVHPDDPAQSTAVAAGMAAVLSAGVRSGSGGPPPATVGQWARQLLTLESAQRVPVALPRPGMPERAEAPDPLVLAIQSLARGGDPTAASELLGEGRTMDVLLARAWTDGGAALADLVALAGQDSGPDGERVVRHGLEIVGAGLRAEDPDDRTVNRATATAVAPGLGAAAAAHVEVVARALASVSAEDGATTNTDLLRGLGYLTADRQAAGLVEVALADWAAAQTRDLTGSSRADPLPAVAVPSAYLAVQEYGQRLAHALDGFDLQDEAQDKAAVWNLTAGLLLEGLSFVPVPPVALAANVARVVAPAVLDVDGSFEQGPDRGLRFDEQLAGLAAVASLPPELAGRVDAARVQAETAFGRVARALGTPVTPTSPEEWRLAANTVTNGALDLATGRAADDAGRRGFSFASLFRR